MQAQSFNSKRKNQPYHSSFVVVALYSLVSMNIPAICWFGLKRPVPISAWASRIGFQTQTTRATANCCTSAIKSSSTTITWTEKHAYYYGSRLFSSSAVVQMAVTGADVLTSFEAQKAKSFEGLDVAQAMEALANADAVCFDVDSTVIREEGIVSRLFASLSVEDFILNLRWSLDVTLLFNSIQS